MRTNRFRTPLAPFDLVPRPQADPLSSRDGSTRPAPAAPALEKP